MTEPTTTPTQIHFPGQTEQAQQLEQLKQLQTEIREIQTTTAENGRNTPEPAPTQSNTPAATVAVAETTSRTREPTAAATSTATMPTKTRPPTATALPTPPTDNICRRNPSIQKALINALEISSCRIITNDELFRVEDITTIYMSEYPAPGDLNGLVNLESLELRIQTDEGESSKVPDNTF